MNLIPDSNWLKVLDIKGTIAAAVTAACVVILLLAEYDLLYLGGLPIGVRAFFVIFGIIAFFILLGRLWEAFSASQKESKAKKAEERSLQRQREEDEADVEEQRITTLSFLDTLSEVETEILSYLVQKNQQSFQGEASGGHAAPLKQKGLIKIGSGIQRQNDCSFTIPPYVWEELQNRKDEFNTADLTGPHPWRVHWMLN